MSIQGLLRETGFDFVMKNPAIRMVRKVAANPVLAGGGTAVAVTFFFFGANALWYQPQAHPGAFFHMRPIPYVSHTSDAEPAALPPLPQSRTKNVVLQHDAGVHSKPEGDPRIQVVQEVLTDLNLYTGSIDGLAGPQTREAVVSYRKIMGLGGSGEIDPQLLQHLGATPDRLEPAGDNKSIQKNASVPVPTPRSEVVNNGTQSTVPAGLSPDPLAGEHTVIVRVQAGLREFGNDAIVLDGMLGNKTEAAIREFQRFFDLPVTGRIDEALVSKMEEIGLISM